MTRFYIVLLLALLLLGNSSFAQRKSYDFGNLSQEEIEELRTRPHPCAESKSRHGEAAVKQALLNQALRLNASQADYDVKYYGIDLSIDFGSETIAGHIDYLIESVTNGLNSVDLNLMDSLTVDSVTIDGGSVSYSHFADILSITTPSPISSGVQFEMTVYYHGHPYYGFGYTNSGMAFDYHNGNTVCWTATEPWGSRNWWPCKDTPSDKADSLDMIFEYPESYDLATNGVIVSEENLGGGRKRTHYHSNYPIVTYLVAVSISDFVVETKTWEYDGHSMPVFSYTFPNAYESRQLFDDLTTVMLDIYSDAFGIYPFYQEKLANVNCGVWGTMEHQTCSFHDPFSFYDQTYLLIHENGHQWWGDMITCHTFNHIWLNEGLTTWTEAIFYEGLYGIQAYHDYVQIYKYLGGGTIYVEDVYNDVIFDFYLSYAKGSWVPHMLRGVLGDSVFFKAIGDWYNSPYQYGTATTADFTTVISASVGYDMSWFVDQWIYGEGHPDYEVSWVCEADTGDGYRLTYIIEQTQPGGTIFEMPIEHQFQTTGPTFDTTLWNERQVDTYFIWFPDSVTNVVVDPQEWILRRVQTVAMTMRIVSRDLPDGELGVPYFFQLQAAGGVEPYFWTKLGGDMPIGCDFEGGTTGTISGTPEWPDTYFFTIKVEDSDSPPVSDVYGFSLTIREETEPPLVGDADGNGIIEVTDAVFLIAYIFTPGAPAPDPLEVGDCDCNGQIEISDAVFLISYIFIPGSPEPNCP